tara:strand:- start:189 stop:686 length:498 start_codon:yes stop_codon:yes gene_type:complete
MNRFLVLGIVAIGIMTRLLPHPPNFTPILSFALLSGVYSKNNLGIFIPISIMLLSDMILGSHSTIIWVYSSLFVIYLIGYYFINNISFKNVLLGSLVGSFLFFVLTNLGVWFIGYPKTIEGLIACYVAAIPFYKNTLLSTVIYTSIIHSAYSVLSKNILSFQSSK